MGFGVLMLLVLLLGSWSAFELRALGSRMNEIVNVNNEQVALANGLLNAIDAMAIQSRSIALVVDLTTLEGEVKEFNRLLNAYRQAEGELAKALANADPTSSRGRILTEILSARAAALPALEQAVKQGSESATVEAAATLDKARPIETVWRNKVGEFVSLQKAASAEVEAEAQRRQQSVLITGLVIVSAALMIGCGVGYWITVGIKRPIQNAILVAERVAEGDLTTAVRVTGRDEVGRLLAAVASMQSRLGVLVHDIRASATHIQVASAEVAAGNADLSQRTERTAATLQATTGNMSDLTGMVRRCADAAVRASDLASSAAAVATAGG